MQIPSRSVAFAGTILLGIVLASCDGKERSSQPTSPSPLTPAAPLITRLAVIVPDSIPPGESVQLTANAIRSDNSVENVTAQAQWSSSNMRVIEVSSTGIAKAVAVGEAFVNARYQSHGATARTLVLPAGTFRLTGTVTESGFGLSGVTLTAGDQTTVTNAVGGYVFYGVGGHVVIHAQRDGYFNKLVEVDVLENRSFDFDMVASRQRMDLRGDYMLTIGGGVCPPTFTPAASVRTYSANVTQDGARVTVTLGGADFIITRGRGNHFDGFLDPGDNLTFAIGDVGYYYYYGQYDIVERFGETSALIVSGHATARPSSSGVSGTMTGSIMLAQGTTTPFNRIQSSCSAANHRFEMVRR
jgi:Bacterial Ig-like domain (group 2)